METEELIETLSRMDSDLLEMENDPNDFVSFMNKSETKQTEPKEAPPPVDQDTPFLSSFLVELTHSIKNTLASIKHFTVLSEEKLDDAEFRKLSQKSISEDIKKIDSVLNSLLNYININTPLTKTNTMSLLLEEVLEANEKQLLEKKIKIFRKCDKVLPETFIHDEQVKFIFNSILQFAILSTPPNGSIGFLVKSFDIQNGLSEKKNPLEKNGYVEAVVGFMGGEKSARPAEAGSPEDSSNLILQLVKEILQKNHGTMKLEVDEKKSKTLVTLRFPIERRKVIYYEPINL
jgi:light-regulated signal transduction histidine kinase (bacteriophytochrome)